MRLTEMRPGQRAVVAAYQREGGEELRLMEMGLLPGTEFHYVRRAPMGDPLELEVRGFHLSLRASEAAAIDVIVR